MKYHLTKEELSNMVIDYQNKSDNMLSNTNAEFTSLRGRFTKMESQLLVKRRVNDNLVKQNRILKRKRATNEQYSRRECLEISRFPDSIRNNNLEETVLKIFNETGVTVSSRDVKACHSLNQKADDDYAHEERKCEAKRSNMSKKYHFIGQNQLK